MDAQPLDDAEGVLDETLTIERPDADLYVERCGPEAAPVVYYLHGGPGYNSHSFRDLAGDDLTRFQMLYADQRGAGRSYGSGSADLALLAQDVAAVLTGLQLDGATLLAHGFGAMVAVQAATDYPELVKGLVLVNPWLSMPLLAGTLNRAAAAIAGGVAPAVDGGAGEEVAGDPTQLVDEAFGLVNPKTLFDALQFPTPASRLRLEHADSEALLGPSEEDVPVGVWQLDVLDLLGAIAVPVVVIAGTQDGTSFPVQAEAALARMPAALTSLLATGHYPWIDDPETFVPLIHDALDHAGASR